MAEAEERRQLELEAIKFKGAQFSRPAPGPRRTVDYGEEKDSHRRGAAAGRTRFNFTPCSLSELRERDRRVVRARAIAASFGDRRVLRRRRRVPAAERARDDRHASFAHASQTRALQHGSSSTSSRNAPADAACRWRDSSARRHDASSPAALASLPAVARHAWSPGGVGGYRWSHRRRAAAAAGRRPGWAASSRRRRRSRELAEHRQGVRY